MAVPDWPAYVWFLDGLALQRDKWAGSKTLAEFDTAVRTYCAELLGAATEGQADPPGYTALAKALAEEFVEPETVYAQIRLAALAVPARELQPDLDEDWAIWWLSERVDEATVCGASRFEPPDQWEDFDEPAPGAEPESGLDQDPESLSEFEDDESEDEDALDSQAAETVRPPGQELDPVENRWRRLDPADDEYEYYHNTDGVWERKRGQTWYRRHERVAQWLPYSDDGQRKLWYFDGKWSVYDDVNPQTATTAPAGAGDPYRAFLSQVFTDVPEAAATVSPADLLAMTRAALEEARRGA